MKKKVLVTRAVFDETLAYLAEHVDVTSNQADAKYSPDELADRLQGMNAAVITTGDRVDQALLSRCPSVRAFCTASVGYNHIDVAACTQRGVAATNTPGVLTNSVADFAVCLTLATCRRLTEGEAFLRSGAWRGTHLKELLGVDLHHATVGICGFGRIGQVIAQRLRGFEPKVVYCARNRVDAGIERELGATYLPKDDLLRQSDIVILILPYTQETHHFIGAPEFGLMKRTAVLVNMARGGVVDESALVEALKARKIFAAGLDVYENEPQVNFGLLGLKNVVLSPHIASASEPTRQSMAMTAARNCVAALTMGRPPNIVNPEVLRG